MDTYLLLNSNYIIRSRLLHIIHAIPYRLLLIGSIIYVQRDFHVNGIRFTLAIARTSRHRCCQESKAKEAKEAKEAGSHCSG